MMRFIYLSAIALVLAIASQSARAGLDSPKNHSVDVLFERVKIPAWDRLKDMFPPSPDVLPSPSGNDPEDEIWIDGFALRSILHPVLGAGGKFSAILKHLLGLRLIRNSSALGFGSYFDQKSTIQLADEKTVENWRLYAIDIPKTARCDISLKDSVITIEGLADGLMQGADVVTIKVKLPILPDEVYVRQASLDLVSGNIHVEAGILGDSIVVVGDGVVAMDTSFSVDIWETILANLKFSIWPR